MDASLGNPRDCQDRSDDIHNGKAAQATVTRPRKGSGKREFKDEHPAVRAAPTQLLSDAKICHKCADVDFRGALQKFTRNRKSRRGYWSKAIYDGIYVTDAGHQYRQAQLTDCALYRVLFASRICFEQGDIASEDGDKQRLFEFLKNSELFSFRH